MIHPILKCSILFMANSPTACGGLICPVCWFRKKFSKRSGLHYSIAVTALSNFIYN